MPSSVDTDVVIVGGGPSGLVLGLFLATFKIKSVILEKDAEITQDPRAVVLTGPALRSIWKLGGGKFIYLIGQELSSFNFHDSSFRNEPFLSVNIEGDRLENALPTTVLMNQPKLEYFLRELIAKSQFSTLCTSCEVIDREESADSVIVHYLDQNRVKQEIRSFWLVGADGKRGVVRKRFLEPSAGIRQEVGLFEYDGIWIAANLKITPPTPQTHPELPYWHLGWDPLAVFDLFWPPGWHFCRPPGRPIATGRIGPSSEHLWRHELAVPEWDDSMNAEEIFWENLTPMITHTFKTQSNSVQPITFPRDCIEVLRCRPFRFNHRVVNRWFENRTMLIGDAAHVFPPFGGQGVVSGIQDAENLAWRLAALLKTDRSSPNQTSLLKSWAAERRLGVDNSARFTMLNGKLCNDGPTFIGQLQVYLIKVALSVSSHLPHPSFEAGLEANGYKASEDGTFLRQFGGGARLAQIYVEFCHKGSRLTTILLSDNVLRSVPTIFSLIMIRSPRSSADALANELELLASLITKSGISNHLLSRKSILIFDPTTSSNGEKHRDEIPVFSPASSDDLITYPRRGLYDANQFMRRIGNSRIKYVIVRPDQIIYAKATSLPEFQECLNMLKERV